MDEAAAPQGPPLMKRLFQRIEHEARMGRPAHAPADNTPGVGIDDEGDIDKAGPARLSLSETLYGWLSRANRVKLRRDGRCCCVAVVCAEQLVSLKSAARGGDPDSPAADQCVA